MLPKGASSTDSGGLRLRGTEADAEPGSLDTHDASCDPHAAGIRVSLVTAVLFAMAYLAPHALRFPAAYADHGGGQGAGLGNCPGRPCTALGKRLLLGKEPEAELLGTLV